MDSNYRYRELVEAGAMGRFYRLAALTFAAEMIVALWISGAFRPLG
jgi:hypothetical protein